MSRLPIVRLAGLALLALGTAAGPLAAQSTINQFSLTGAAPLEIEAGPDGNLWYAVSGDGSAGSSRVGRITTAGTVTEFVLADGSQPTGIVAGPDGAMWFTEFGADAIGRIDTATFPAGASVTLFTAGITAGATPFGICVGPDGNLWFTERGLGRIGRITTGGAVLNQFPIGAPASTPLGITAGPDGNIWFTDRGTTSAIGAMTTAGAVVKFIATPTAGSNPSGITTGPDGRIWYVAFTGGKVGVLATSATLTGDITEFTAPTSSPFRIVSGPDGALWFTENGGGPAGRIARITTAGTITEYTTAGLGGPYGIAVGPDRAIWFTERDNVPTKVGQLVVDCVVTVPTITGGGTQCEGTTLTLTASAGFASYQWFLGGSPIGGATSATYTKTAVPADTGAYTVTGTNGTCTSNASAAVSVTVTAQPVATAGGPQGICTLGTTAGLGGSTPTGGATGAWSIVTVGVTGTFNPDATTPNATFTHTGGAGPITLRWTVSNAPCGDATADVVVTVSQPPTAATAGGPQTICALGTTTGLGGNTPAVGTGAWSVVSGGTGTFSPNAATPNATFTNTGGAGPVLLAWTITSGACVPSVANVTITLTPAPTPATAGGPQTICALGTTAGLGGNTPGVGTGTWSVVSGGTGTFSPNAAAPNATFTHTTGTGPVLLAWTITNGTCAPSIANVTVTITPPPTAATAGGPQTICALGTTAGLGGNTPTTGAGTWSVVSGGTGTFSPNATTPNATFTHTTGVGPVLLAWTITNGTCAPSIANVTVTITPPPTAATAGGPQTICALGTTAGLGGNTPTTGAGTWSVVSGGTGTFAPNATTPNATFTHTTGAGPVLLAWTITNGTCAPSIANVTVTVNQPPTTATAGGAQTICSLATTVPLGGNAPTVGTGAWSVVSGGTGTFAPNATTPNATFTHTGGAGPVTLRWTISNAPCTASTKDVVVTISQQPTAATAGGPQTICALGTTAGLGGNTPAVGSGTWSVTSGGTGTFSPNATTPNAAFTHTAGAGPVVLTWTISNGSCAPTTATVTITVHQPPTASTVGGPQTICNLGSSQPLGGNTPAVGAGIWSVVSGGTGTFSPNVTTPNATFTHMGGAGPVVLAWTISNPPCAPSAANVTLTIGPNQTVTINAPAKLCAGSTATASVPNVGGGTTYAWSVTNGTIVSGQGTPTLVFSAGPSGSVKLDLVQVDSSCTSNGTVTIPIDTGCAGPLGFTPITPCRRIDTRFAADAPVLAAGEQRTFVLTGAPCSIPSTAKAVSVNMTVTQAAAPGDLRLFATGTPVPPSTAINFRQNQTRADNSVVALSSDGTGRIDVKNDSAGTVHVIIDVNGYFR